MNTFGHPKNVVVEISNIFIVYAFQETPTPHVLEISSKQE